MKKKILLIPVILAFALLLMPVVLAKENYSIPTAITAPVIDGVIGSDEWNNALIVDVSSDQLGWVLPQVDGMNIGAGSYVAFMWDKDNLYCAANILDATTGAQPASGGPLNSGDGVQLCFYTDEAATNGDGTTNMFWDFLPRTGDGDASTAECYEHFTFMSTLEIPIKSTVQSSGSYTVEWAIPWSLFAEANESGYDVTYTGTAGTKMLIEITIMDHDGTTQALGYSTDEWCVAGTTDVYTLTTDPAGIVSVVEEPTPEPEAPAESTPVQAVSAPATADFTLAVSALALAAAAVTVFVKKK